MAAGRDSEDAGESQDDDDDDDETDDVEDIAHGGDSLRVRVPAVCRHEGGVRRADRSRVGPAGERRVSAQAQEAQDGENDDDESDDDEDVACHAGTAPVDWRMERR